MIRLIRLFAALAMLIAAPVFVDAVRAQEGTIDLPSMRPSEIYLSNPTSGKVIFYLETERTYRKEWTLEAGEAATFTGSEGDGWFNIEIFSGGTSRKYGVDTGGRFYFFWNGGVLELATMR